ASPPTGAPRPAAPRAAPGGGPPACDATPRPERPASPHGAAEPASESAHAQAPAAEPAPASSSHAAPREPRGAGRIDLDQARLLAELIQRLPEPDVAGVERDGSGLHLAPRGGGGHAGTALLAE